MRGILMLLGALALVGLAGCGGGGGVAKSVTIPTDQVRLTYFHWKVGTVAGSGGPEDEFHEVFAKLTVPQSAPLRANMTLALEGLTRALVMSGPASIAPEDGLCDDTVPLHVYWGSGNAPAAGQPLTVQPGEWLPGYVRPGDLYFYAGRRDLDGPIPLGATPALAADGGYARAWTLPAGQMLAIPSITYPLAPVINTVRPARIAWGAVPGAAGYLVTVEGEALNDDGQMSHRVIWTSAARPITFDALYDPTADLLPADAREVFIPVGIFTRCESVQVSVFAQSAPDIDATMSPSITRVNAAMGTYAFGTFQMR